MKSSEAVKYLTKKGVGIKHLSIGQDIREKCLNCSDWMKDDVKKCPHTDC